MFSSSSQMTCPALAIAHDSTFSLSMGCHGYDNGAHDIIDLILTSSFFYPFFFLREAMVSVSRYPVSLVPLTQYSSCQCVWKPVLESDGKTTCIGDNLSPREFLSLIVSTYSLNCKHTS